MEKKHDWEDNIERVRQFFEETNQPNIYPLEFVHTLSLETLEPGLIKESQSKKIVLDIVNAILHLKTQKFQPCQLRFSHVVSNSQKVWGLRHAICYRSNKQIPGEKITVYDPTEYYYHEDNQNELMWNLGKIWLRFFTRQSVNIIDKNQNRVDDLVYQAVRNKRIARAITELLTVKSGDRITFQHFLQHQIFDEQQLPSKIYKGVFSHLNMESNINFTNNRYNSQKSLKICSPFEEEILRRNMKQSLEIHLLLQKVKQYLENRYEKNIDIIFSEIIIDIYAYCIMKELDNQKIINSIQDYSGAQRRFYSKFVRKMLIIKENFAKKIKRIQNYKLSSDQEKIILNPENFILTYMHPHFKQMIMVYYQNQQNFQEVGKLEKQKNCLLLLIARTCNGLFNGPRQFIFKEVMVREKRLVPLKIPQLLNFIENCTNYRQLQSIRKKIINYYFK